MTTQTPILKAENLSKIFPGSPPISILEDISLELYEGQSIAIVGKSGSGKSSLLHILGTLDTPTTGRVLFPKAPPSYSVEDIRSCLISFVFQSFHLLEDYTLLDNILMPMRIARKKQDESKALEILKKIDLLDKKDYPVKLLSGGEKQRASIGRALCNDQDILFVDEPTGSLDPINAAIVQDLLIRCVKNQKKSMILVTHDEEFASHCDIIYLLKKGHLSIQ